MEMTRFQLVLPKFSQINMSSDQPNSTQSKLVNLAKEYLPTLAVAGLIVFVVRSFIAEPRYIPSSSMEPTLQINDRLIIEKLSYRFRKPERGEVVVFNPPAVPVVPDASLVYIKRLVGLPGDRISIRDGKVFVNDQALNEPYIKEAPDYTLPTLNPEQCPNCFIPNTVMPKGKTLSFTVPPNSYWMMGDNRNNSLDSHAWGFLPETNIVGRAFFRYWPPDDRFGELVTPQYQNLPSPITKK
jgi:signal peptidase I